ncbi:MAG: ABC transporter ATP-binding protein, partial [Bacteroidetes bacterium]|nr:ABC transporter ATP-binding protein [Bacteroidota bacterium]
MKKLLLDNLTFGYSKNEILFDKVSIDLSNEANKGLVIALMGESGSGKTTLLKLLLGIEKPLLGAINLDPKDSVLSYVPQEPVLFDHLSPM